MLELPKPTSDTPSLDAMRDAFRSLTPTAAPRWGRMNAAQMTRHCRVFVELCLGRVRVGWLVRVLARALGPMMLRRMMRKSPTEAPKNLTTLAPLRAADGEKLDLDVERDALFAALDDLTAAPDPMQHPLYGAMPRGSVEALVRHHTAHHVNQFGLLPGA